MFLTVYICVCDEATCRFLENELSDLIIFNVNGYCDDCEQAVLSINTERPEIVILDTCFGEKSGFDLMEKIEYDPSVIFVSECEDLAADAYNVGAADFLIKPLSRNRLALALLRTISKPVIKIFERISTEKHLILCRKQNDFYPVKAGDIMYVAESGKYADIHTLKGCYKSSVKWNVIKASLPSDTFVEISPDLLLSLAAISSIEKKAVIIILFI